MSTRTKCNFCTRQLLRIQAANRHTILVIRRRTDGSYVAMFAGEEQPVATFTALTLFCVCGS